jgi:hypothetical protein
MPQDALIRLAKTILEFNWAGGYTRPGPRLYPHQWSWDSALIAIGYARYDQDLAEIARVLGGDPSPFEKRAEQTTRAMNRKLWDEERATYLSFDLVEDQIGGNHEGFFALYEREILPEFR